MITETTSPSTAMSLPSDSSLLTTRSIDTMEENKNDTTNAAATAPSDSVTTSSMTASGGSIDCSIVDSKGSLLTKVAPRSKLTGLKHPEFSPERVYQCPICLRSIQEAFITKCGHSFCYKCIDSHLQYRQDCPTCGGALSRDQIFPNFTLNQILMMNNTAADSSSSKLRVSSSVCAIQSSLLRTPDQWSLHDVDSLMTTLLQRRRSLKIDDREVEIEVLSDFLNESLQKRQEALRRLQEDLALLTEDVERVSRTRREIQCAREDVASSSSASHLLPAVKRQRIVDRVEVPDDQMQEKTCLPSPRVPAENNEPCNNIPSTSSKSKSASLSLFPFGNDERNFKIMESTTSVAYPPISSEATRVASAMKRKVYTHFEDLQACYFDVRSQRYGPSSLSAHSVDPLKCFLENLTKFTRFSRMRTISILKYGDLFTSSSIVSSIEFDRDAEYFATAGVTKKIKVFEYNAVAQSTVGVHYPIKEMVGNSKISCLSWNSYIKSQIASSDYEGIVSLWDAYTGQLSVQFDEHERRAWSVDFSRADPTRLASGSDDARVKIWSTNQRHSVATIEGKANVCCVKFNPDFSHHIAFGSADHHIQYYDLRKLSEPLMILKGHRKAVSYAKFINRDELVSASTDSTLRLWSVSRGECIRKFTGHTNEKNFVGLSVNADFMACGSENNSVYCYYKSVSKPMIHYRFGSCNPATGEDTDDEASQFVSSVCWKQNSNTLLAANSQGTIKVLEMVS